MSDENSQDFEEMLASALGTTPSDEVGRAIETEIVDVEDVPEGHKSGYVAVVGEPNVGKSTLINRILGEKIAIVSSKPQTTRIRQLGILTRDDVQAIFVDTPGLHKPDNNLGRFMNDVAHSALEDADVILFVVGVNYPPTKMDEQIARRINTLSRSRRENVINVMNKMDIAPPHFFQDNFEAYRKLVPDAEFEVTVAADGHNVDDLVAKIINRLPEGPRYYPADQVSDVPIRGIMAEMLREKVLHYTHQEVPHSIAVEVDEFTRRNDKLVYIHATIYVEREGQKGITIGKGGKMLKRIATKARAEMGKFLESDIYLEIKVKVLPNWRQDEKSLKRFGYRL